MLASAGSPLALGVDNLASTTTKMTMLGGRRSVGEQECERELVGEGRERGREEEEGEREGAVTWRRSGS